MAFSIGDVVHTKSGLLYTVSTLYTHRETDWAMLRPMRPGPSRRVARAGVDSLTLVRTRELSLASHYAAEADRATEAWQRDRMRRWSSHWLGRAIERNDDPQAGLSLMSDRLFDLEEAPCAS